MLCECCGTGCAPRCAWTTRRCTVFDPTSSTPNRISATLVACSAIASRSVAVASSACRSAKCPSTSPANGSSSPTRPTRPTRSRPTSPGCARGGRASSAAAATGRSRGRAAPAAATTAQYLSDREDGKRVPHTRQATHPGRVAVLRQRATGRRARARPSSTGPSPVTARTRSGTRPGSSTARASSPTATISPPDRVAHCTCSR